MGNMAGRKMPFPGSRLKKNRQTFDDGAVIFREGKPSDTAFELVSGQVEISKQGDGGRVRLATLAPGDMFGEMGVLDKGTRSATATAAGGVTANAISRKDFLAGVQEKPEIALNIMTQMAERLRQSGDQIAHGGAAASAPVKAPGGALSVNGLPKQVRPDQADDAGPGAGRKKDFWPDCLILKTCPRSSGSR